MFHFNNNAGCRWLYYIGFIRILRLEWRGSAKLYKTDTFLICIIQLENYFSFLRKHSFCTNISYPVYPIFFSIVFIISNTTILIILYMVYKFFEQTSLIIKPIKFRFISRICVRIEYPPKSFVIVTKCFMNLAKFIFIVGKLYPLVVFRLFH